MEEPRLPRCFPVVALIVLLLLPMFAFAQWIPDGTPVCTYSGHQHYQGVNISSDGSGGAVITWCDIRGETECDIYAQRVDASGVPQWTLDGVAICAAAYDQYHSTIAPDGAGGAIITWQDMRDSAATYWDIYAQRMDGSGTALWTPGGVALCTEINRQDVPHIASDGTGGAIVAWKDDRLADNLNPDIYARRVDGSGNVLWTANGVAICTAEQTQGEPCIVSDGSGGALITWHDYRGDDSDIYVQRIDGSGNVQWTADGVAICTAVKHQNRPQMIPTGSGGAIVAWDDLRIVVSYDIYAQRVDEFGNVQWTADGVAICTATGYQTHPKIVTDGMGGGIITWQDNRSGDYDIYAQRVDGLGNTQWTADGVVLCAAANEQSAPNIVTDGAGGAIVNWGDYRSGTDNRDLYAQRVCIDGVAGANTPVGSRVEVTPMDETTGEYPVTLTFDEVTQSGTTTLITSSSGPPPPNGFRLGTPPTYYDLTTTASFVGNITICIDYSNVQYGNENNLKLLHHEGGWVDRTISLDTVNDIICAEVTSLSPFGLFDYDDPSGMGDDGLPARYSLGQNYPNPFNPSTVIHYDVPVGGGNLTLRIYDVDGRLVRMLIDGYQTAGEKTARWNGKDTSGRMVATGIYFCQLKAMGFSETRKMVLMK